MILGNEWPDPSFHRHSSRKGRPSFLRSLQAVLRAREIAQAVCESCKPATLEQPMSGPLAEVWGALRNTYLDWRDHLVTPSLPAERPRGRQHAPAEPG